jgi:opacity protein-like surface antigen
MTLRKPLIAGFLLSVMVGAPAALAQKGPKGAANKAAAAASASAAASAAAASAAALTSPPPMASMATPTATAGAAPPPAGSANGTIDGQTYAVRLRDLEQRVDELKEQIRRSHTRLSLLSDSVLSSGAQGSRAEIVFQNDMSNAFRLRHALFVLDGAVQYNKADDTGALGEQPTIPIFSGSVPPGDHTLQVLVELQGNGYGVFSYLKGYKFEVRSTHSFTSSEGKTMNLQVIAYEKGGVTTPLEERPAVRYFEKVASGIQGGAGTPPPGASAGPVTGGISVGAGGK